MKAWKLVLLGLTGVSAIIACSSSSSGGGGTDCTKLETCCTSAEKSACTVIASGGSETACTNAVAAYCGGSSGTGSGTGAHAGSGTGAGTGAGAGSSCNVAASHYCFNYTGVTSAEQSAVASACSAESGTAGTACPTADVVGCCTMKAAAGGYGTEECYYSGNGSAYTASIVMSACANGTFSATP